MPSLHIAHHPAMGQASGSRPRDCPETASNISSTRYGEYKRTHRNYFLFVMKTPHNRFVGVVVAAVVLAVTDLLRLHPYVVSKVQF